MFLFVTVAQYNHLITSNELNVPHHCMFSQTTPLQLSQGFPVWVGLLYNYDQLLGTLKQVNVN